MIITMAIMMSIKSAFVTDMVLKTAPLENNNVINKENMELHM